MRIGLISDTHAYIDEEILGYFDQVDEIWHAGDIGGMETVKSLQAIKPLVAVHGNIDDFSIRELFPSEQIFERGGVKVFLTHIGGYPGRYAPGIEKKLQIIRPGLFVCGHSHILRVMPDRSRGGLLYINPGAAGHTGLHVVRTIVKIDIQGGVVKDMEVIELGKRGKIKPAGRRAGL